MAANFDYNKVKFMPETVSELLTRFEHHLKWLCSLFGIWADTALGQVVVLDLLTQDSIAIMQIDDLVFRDQWIIERLSQTTSQLGTSWSQKIISKLFSLKNNAMHLCWKLNHEYSVQ